MEIVTAPMDLREGRPADFCQIYTLFDLFHSSRGRKPPPPPDLDCHLQKNAAALLE